MGCDAGSVAVVEMDLVSGRIDTAKVWYEGDVEVR